MGITLKEIAELAGVHKSTVDKVIHNRPGVSDKKRAEIRRLLEEHHYESNPLAKALNYQKKKMSVAVVLPRVDAHDLLKQGMDLVIQDFASFNIAVEFYETAADDSAKQAEILKMLANENISGIVLLPIESEEVGQAMHIIEQAKIPLVTVNTDLKEAPRFCYVGQDMDMGGRVAARMMALKLADRGVLGVISSRNNQATKARAEAFSAYIDEIRPELTLSVRKEIRDTEEEAYRAAKELFGEYKNLDGLYITCGNVKTICNAMKKSLEEGVLKKMPVVICHERYNEILELIRDDVIFASVNGELLSQGRLSMRVLFEYMIYDRKPEQEVIHVGNEVLLKENVG